MIHTLNLSPSPFEMIKSGRKTIELRLYDERRQSIEVGDTLVFVHTEDASLTLTAKVTDLHRFPDFAALYAALPLEKCGYLPEEIAAEMNLPVEKVRDILKIAQEPVSLETPIGEEEDSHLGDFIPDDDAPEPAEAASFTLLKEQLVEVLGTLTPREEKVLRLRFGIEDGRTRTLEEVGKEFNVTRERIRQIEAKALRKLRHPSRSKKLKDFLN